MKARLLKIAVIVTLCALAVLHCMALSMPIINNIDTSKWNSEWLLCWLLSALCMCVIHFIEYAIISLIGWIIKDDVNYLFDKFLQITGIDELWTERI